MIIKNLNQLKPLILASGSKIRQQLLSSLGLNFRVIPSDCDEEAVKKQFSGQDWEQLGLALARAKALLVSRNHPQDYVIAADQLCVLGTALYDKPLSHEVAVSHLKQLRGKTHQQIACMVIAKQGDILWQHTDVANLNMLNLSDTAIEAYLQLEKPYHSCGAYQFETQGQYLFEKVEGESDTILGLTLEPLVHALRDLRVIG